MSSLREHIKKYLLLFFNNFVISLCPKVILKKKLLRQMIDMFIWFEDLFTIFQGKFSYLSLLCPPLSEKILFHLRCGEKGFQFFLSILWRIWPVSRKSWVPQKSHAQTDFTTYWTRIPTSCDDPGLVWDSQERSGAYYFCFSFGGNIQNVDLPLSPLNYMPSD